MSFLPALLFCRPFPITSYVQKYADVSLSSVQLCTVPHSFLTKTLAKVVSNRCLLPMILKTAVLFLRLLRMLLKLGDSSCSALLVPRPGRRKWGMAMTRMTSRMTNLRFAKFCQDVHKWFQMIQDGHNENQRIEALPDDQIQYARQSLHSYLLPRSCVAVTPNNIHL